MTIRLYQQSLFEALRLTNDALLKLGFTTSSKDKAVGTIRAQKKLTRSDQIIFFDAMISGQNHEVSISVISNSFSERTCTFVADAESEELFLETLHDLLRIQPPDNPMKLEFNDYAWAIGF